LTTGTGIPGGEKLGGAGAAEAELPLELELEEELEELDEELEELDVVAPVTTPALIPPKPGGAPREDLPGVVGFDPAGTGESDKTSGTFASPANLLGNLGSTVGTRDGKFRSAFQSSAEGSEGISLLMEKELEGRIFSLSTESASD